MSDLGSDEFEDEGGPYLGVSSSFLCLRLECCNISTFLESLFLTTKTNAKKALFKKMI